MSSRGIPREMGTRETLLMSTSLIRPEGVTIRLLTPARSGMQAAPRTIRFIRSTKEAARLRIASGRSVAGGRPDEGVLDGCSIGCSI